MKIVASQSPGQENQLKDLNTQYKFSLHFSIHSKQVLSVAYIPNFITKAHKIKANIIHIYSQ